MEDWIVDARHRVLSPDRYGPHNRPDRVWPIEAVVWHYTGPGTAAGARAWLTTVDRTIVSAHFVLDRDGTLFQLVPLSERAVHAGGSTSTLFGKGNVNGRTIGIEMANVGPLTKEPGHAWLDSMMRPFGGCVGQDAHGRAWEVYDPRQIDAACILAAKLAELFPQTGVETATRHIGHQHVDPTRKLDPGPMFPWALIRAAAATVAASKLRNA